MAASGQPPPPRKFQPPIAPVRLPTPPPDDPAAPGAPSAVLVAPVGCELIVRGVKPKPSASPSQQVQAALDEIYRQKVDDEDRPYPAVARAPRSKGGVKPAWHCFVALDPSIRAYGSEPRHDLLTQWLHLLRIKEPDWHISPVIGNHDDKDKASWLTLAGIPTDADVTKALEEIKNVFAQRKWSLVDHFSYASSIVLVLPTPSAVAAAAGNFVLKTLPSFRFGPNYQIVPENIFEMAVKGVAGIDPAWIQAAILNFVEKGMRPPTVANDVRVVAHYRWASNDCFAFTMTNWDATATVLCGRDRFVEHFKKLENLEPPDLIYNINSFRPAKRGPEARIDAASDALQGALAGVTASIADFKRSAAAAEAKIDARLQALESNSEKTQAALTQLLGNVNMLGNSFYAFQQGSLAMDHAYSLERERSETRTALLYARHNPEETARLEARVAELTTEISNVRTNARSQLLGGQGCAPQPMIPPPPETPPRRVPSRNLSTSSAATTDKAHGTKRTADGNPIPTNRKDADDMDQVRIPAALLAGPLAHIKSRAVVTGVRPRACVPQDRVSSTRLSVFASIVSCIPIRLAMLLITMSLFLSCLPCAAARPPTFSLPAASLKLYSLNANGLGNTMKVASIRQAIASHQPHVFVLAETQADVPVASALDLDSEYEILEEPGLRCPGATNCKWGVIVGIRKNTLQLAQRLAVAQTLRGRVIAIDVLLRTSAGKAYLHRIIGFYAPWHAWEPDNPQSRESAESDACWSAVSDLCTNTQTGWTVLGDLNNTLASVESRAPRGNRHNRYRKFLDDTAGIDLWLEREDRHFLRDWTCTSKNPTKPVGASIIDRAAVSPAHVAERYIETASGPLDFIPGSDHRAILVHILPVPPSAALGHTVTHDLQLAIPQPRLRYPQKNETHKFSDFADNVKMRLQEDAILSAINSYTDIPDDDTWSAVYRQMTDIIVSCGEESFGRNRPYKPRLFLPTSSEIKEIQREINAIGGALRLLRDPSTTQVSRTSRLYLSNAAASHAITGSPGQSLEKCLILRRKERYKTRYRLAASLVRQAAEQYDKSRILATLHGKSSKRLVTPTTFIGLPLAVSSPGSDDLIADPDGVKAATAEYFSNLYARQPEPQIEKPWLNTPSVVEIRRKVAACPFQWPQPATVDDFRMLMRKGNPRPMPNDDGMEKWCVRHLPDSAMTVMTALHNYEVMHSRFPDSVRDKRISMIHKRGLRTNLDNWRGISIAALLWNSPAAWLNHLLMPYVARMGILPETQIASHKGVQARDLTSFLAGIKCWAQRNKTTVYALKRDQMKGFDRLAPQGFYDAIIAYGLPVSIIALDQAAQAHNRCVVRTAYGYTAPFFIDGVTPQGASLSPFKSGLTTSMGNRYLADLARANAGALTLRTLNARKDDAHTPDDRLALPVTMVEATDDSYIFALTLEALLVFVLAMERFQFAYGWLTQWAKTILSVVGPIPHLLADRLDMPSVTATPGADPMAVTLHSVPVHKGSLQFLNSNIDDSISTRDAITDIINNFAFPKLTVRLPITLIRKIVEQNIISRARPRIALQPLERAHARQLDVAINNLVHRWARFPYHPTPLVLNLPISLHGLGFSSLERLNDATAIEGTIRDLNHPIAAYRTMARITLADWTCSYNTCRNPLSSQGPDASRHKKNGLLPRSLLTAHEAMTTLTPRLHLRRTDQSYILDGDTHIKHVAALAGTVIDTMPSGNAWMSLKSRGLTKLADFGSWSFDKDGPVFAPHAVQPFVARWTTAAPEHWKAAQAALAMLRPQMLVDGDISLMFPRADRQKTAERSIRAVSAAQRLPPARSDGDPTQDWASDGSMLPAAASRHEHRTVTAAVTGPATVVFMLPGRANGILQGEVFGHIAAHVLAPTGAKATLFTDHMNSTRLLHELAQCTDPQTRLLRINARSYYRWLAELSTRHREEGLTMAYTRGHAAGSETLDSVLNAAADHYASRAQSFVHKLPAAPIPTFFMDEFTLASDVDGWIESSPRQHFLHYRSMQEARTLQVGHGNRMATDLYSRSRPEFPYTRAYSAYSALVQLYARSGQLPTALVESERSKNAPLSPLCRYGCSTTESDFHVFVECGRFDNYRAEAGSELRARIERRLLRTAIEGGDRHGLEEASRNFFADIDVWPLGFPHFYLGHVPILQRLVPRTAFATALEYKACVTALESDWHFAAIRLAGRIWGTLSSEMAQRLRDA